MDSAPPSDSYGGFPREYLEAILNNTLDMISRISTDGFFQYVSPSHKSILGHVPEELIGRSIFEFVHPDDYNVICEVFRKALMDKRTEKIEYRYRHKNGHYIWLESAGCPLFNDNGAVWGAIISSRDITEHRAVEMALLESEGRLRLTLDAVNDGIWDWNIPTGEAVFSPRWYIMLGYKPYEFPQNYSSWRSLVHPDDIDRAEREINEHIASGEGYAIEIRMLTKSGYWLWVLTRGKVVKRDASGHPVRMMGTHSDITERKQADEALKESELRFRTMVETAPDAIFIVDPTGAFVEVNNAACNQLGYTREQMLRLHVYDIIPNSLISRAFNRLERMEDASAAYKSCHMRADGTAVPVELNVRKINFMGKPAMLGIARDITWRERAEETLRASLSEKEVLLKEVHHRVKNNLQVVHSLLSIQMNNIKDETARESIAECRNRVKSIALVHERLYQSNNLARIDFAQYLHSLTGSLFSSFGVDPRRITSNLDLDSVFLSIDTAIPCGLIVNELVSNCLKHAFPGLRAGEVQIELRRLDGSSVSLAVRDNGIGLTESTEPLRAKTMGLKLVSALVKQLRGTVQINHNGGTEFKIVFPAEP